MTTENWQRLESRIKEVMQNVDNGDCGYTEGIVRIDCIMADELERGTYLVNEKEHDMYLPKGVSFSSIALEEC